MSTITDFYPGASSSSGYLPKFELLTSGTTWTRPANIVDNLVWVSAIAGGEAFLSSVTYGDGGSYIIRNPYTCGSSVTYAIGAGGVGYAGANGGDTVWGTITLQGGGETDGWGSIGVSSNNTGFVGNLPPAFGASPVASTQFAGGGLVFDGVVYGYGGSGNGGAGCIFLEWMETQ